MYTSSHFRKFLHPTDEAGGPTNSDDSEPAKPRSGFKTPPVSIHAAPTSTEVLDLGKVFDWETTKKELQVLGLNEEKANLFAIALNQKPISSTQEFNLAIEESFQQEDSLHAIATINTKLRLKDYEANDPGVLPPYLGLAYLPSIFANFENEKLKVILGELLDFSIPIPQQYLQTLNEEELNKDLMLVKFYVAVKLFANTASNFDANIANRKKVLDYLGDLVSVKLCKLSSWENTESLLMAWASHLKTTKGNPTLIRFIRKILQDHRAMRELGDSLDPLYEIKYSNFYNYFVSDENIQQAIPELFSDLEESQTSSQLELEIRSKVDPQTDLIKLGTWQDPVSTVLNRAKDRKKVILISEIFPDTKEQAKVKVPLAFRVKDTNSVALNKDLLEGFVNAGFGQFILDINVLTGMQNSIVQEIIDSSEGEGFAVREKQVNHEEKLVGLINDFLDSNQSSYISFGAYLSDLGYFKTGEISLKLSLFLGLIEHLKGLTKKNSIKIIISNDNEEYDSLLKTVYLNTKLPTSNHAELLDGSALLVKQAVYKDSDLEVPGSVALPREKSIYFVELTHSVQNQVAQNQGYGEHKTVASSNSELKPIYEEFVQDISETMPECLKQQLPARIFPDFILTTVNSEEEEESELAPNEVLDKVLV